jgi:hypothetical protein
MQATSELTKNQMRLDKKNGLTILEVSLKYHVAKSTASLICRDVFYYRGRKYNSEKDARFAINAHRNEKPRKRYPSDSKKYPSNNRRPPVVKKSDNRHVLYPCANKCGNMIRQKNGLCRDCYTDMLLKRAEVKQSEKEQRQKTNEANRKRMYPAKVEICPDSPIQRHYWKLNGANVGVCKYCHKVRDFNAKLKKYLPIITAAGS